MMYLPSERIYVSFSRVPGALAILDHLYTDTRIRKTWSWAKVLPCRDLSTSTLLWSWVQPFRISAPNKGRSFSATWQTLASNSMAPSAKNSIAQFFSLLAVPSKTGKHIQEKSSPKQGFPCLGLHPPSILIR